MLFRPEKSSSKKKSRKSTFCKGVSPWFLSKNFWQKPWTNPFAKCRFSRLFRTLLFRSKKHSFLSRISKTVCFFFFFAKKKTYKKKVDFFYKNHGLTPLQNVDFLDFVRTSLLRSEKHSFLSTISKTAFFVAFFSQKKHIRKRSICLQKPWTDLFAKRRLFFTLLELHFSGPKSILYFPEYQKLSVFGFFRWKRTYKKKVFFLTKTMD